MGWLEVEPTSATGEKKLMICNSVVNITSALALQASFTLKVLLRIKESKIIKLN